MTSMQQPRRRQQSQNHDQFRLLSESPPRQLVPLPYDARALSRWDFAAFEPLFAHYLDLQKQLRLADLDEHEVRGRWRRFVGKWNRGELAEGWYEPEMFLRVVRLRAMSLASSPSPSQSQPQSRSQSGNRHLQSQAPV